MRPQAELARDVFPLRCVPDILLGESRRSARRVSAVSGQVAFAADGGPIKSQQLSGGDPMLLVDFKVLNDQAGINRYIKTNSITLEGGESPDAIIDSTGVPSDTYFLYTPQLDHLSNDSRNFGGLMTEIVVVP